MFADTKIRLTKYPNRYIKEKASNFVTTTEHGIIKGDKRIKEKQKGTFRRERGDGRSTRERNFIGRESTTVKTVTPLVPRKTSLNYGPTVVDGREKGV